MSQSYVAEYQEDYNPHPLEVQQTNAAVARSQDIYYGGQQMSAKHNFKNVPAGSAEGFQARSGLRCQWPFTKSPIQSSIGSRLHSQAEVYR